MKNVVIAGYLRTPFTRSKPREPQLDPFQDYTAEELLKTVIRPLLKKSKVAHDEADDFIVGCALGVNEQWTFGGRTPLLTAGLGTNVPARMIDMQCGSGMAAIHTAFLEIACGQKDIAIACGMEHMTRVPVGPYLFNMEHMKVNKNLFKKSDEYDMVTGMNMGLTAELLAERNGYTREMLDSYAERSHRLAGEADESGFFNGEINPIDGQGAEGRVFKVRSDMNIRPETTIEGLSKLKTAFKDGGMITAGNSSPLTTGAAGMVLMSEETASKKGLKPLARIVSTGSAGTRPEMMGTGPVPASLIALKNAGLNPEDINFWEINEAFSAVVMNAVDELKIPMDNVNINGGAISIGHPLGASGVRLVGTLARILQQKNGKIGCATACIGGGQGIATIIERI
ncbi:MAG: acetyl-CoA C-acyltransferase [Denitrovibrio sp.]|nr:MAG: acetyl-CoA C-acyltransferase [Denitrovibrio sp.]